MNLNLIKEMDNYTSSSCNNELIYVLNVNRIKEEMKMEIIKAMGLSACQVGCMSRGCCTHYNSKH